MSTIGENLQKYIEDRNTMCKIFGSFATNSAVMDPNNLTSENIKRLASDLEADLSPENLTCDGELSGAEVSVKYKFLTDARRELAKVAA